ncbi:hypothetical protein [uncultured Muribaculum sp.]|uniref:hypothetical protein n=1 Tax=uncultured Muribaculum sp. TaxID=1918613 RepID=UPI002594E165|nr:hypothetical protein [uncultured Muribaculum sp.]
MTPKIDEIRRLISLYYAGDSSIDDERALTALLQELQDAPEDIAADRDIILALEESRPAMPPALPQKLDAIIAGLDCKHRRHRSIAQAKIAACAAIAILIAGIGWIIKNSEPNPYEVTDPKTAFAETRKALLLVSDGLNSTDALLNEINSTLSDIDFSEYDIDEENDEAILDEEINQPEL